MAFDERGLSNKRAPLRPSVPFGSTMKPPTYGKAIVPKNPYGENFNQRETRASAPAAPPRSPTGGNAPGNGGGFDPGGIMDDPYGGGGIGTSNSVVPAELSAAVPPPVVPDYKDDSEFIAAIADLKSALGDFTSGQDLAKRQYGKGVETTYNRLGWDPAKKQWISRGVRPDTIWNQQNDSTQNDFAARGMFNSGFLADALGKQEREFGNRVSDTLTAQNDYLDVKENEAKSYAKQNNAQLEAARRAAVQRIAAKLGLDPNSMAVQNSSGLQLGVDPASIK